MHFLDRHAVAAPSCLDSYDHTTQKWEDLGSDCKKSVRAALEVIHRHSEESPVCCAYCESPIQSFTSHLEHFRRKRRYPELTFVWDNLFLSCESQDHCGHYKDPKKEATYDPNDLIKPDQEDPHRLLYFHSAGNVVARSGLSEADKKRAEETIRVFGLNESTLPERRRKSAKRYLSEGYLKDLESFTQEDRYAYLEMEIEDVRGQPYFSTIKHTLERL